MKELLVTYIFGFATVVTLMTCGGMRDAQKIKSQARVIDSLVYVNGEIETMLYIECNTDTATLNKTFRNKRQP